jgi:hypothetical protein
MTSNQWISVWFAIASATLAMRQILLSPSAASYPKAPTAVLAFMFIKAGANAFIAMLFWNKPEGFAGSATEPLAWLGFLIATFNTAMLINMLLQRNADTVGFAERLERLEHRTDASVHAEVAALRARRMNGADPHP